ncbi:hypothetical protein ACQI5H_09745 [Mycobacterium heidelbergense]|jgi:hypothetical protein|uniref:hypothetical protein n=1 Tax=Mycobacterium heidelbergense TaxID=53376 RepID=UPI003CFA9EE6
MNVKILAVTSALALAGGIAAAPLATDYPALDLPTLLMLRFYTVPTTGSCDDAACKPPANDHPVQTDELALFRANK